MSRFLTMLALSAALTNTNYAAQIFTTRNDFDIGATSYDEGDLAHYDESTSASYLYFDRDVITSGNQIVAAAHVVNLTKLLITAEGNFTIGSNTFRRGDLALYDSTTNSASLFFDRDLITGGNQNITAATMRDAEHLIFTADGNFAIGGTSYQRGDLVEYNLTTNSSSMFFDRDLITSGSNRINAAHLLSDGDVLFTTRGGATIGGTSFDQGDVIRYDFGSGTASLYLDRDVVTGGDKSISAYSIVAEPSTGWGLGLGGILFALFRMRHRS